MVGKEGKYGVLGQQSHRRLDTRVKPMLEILSQGIMTLAILG